MLSHLDQHTKAGESVMLRWLEISSLHLIQLHLNEEAFDDSWVDSWCPVSLTEPNLHTFVLKYLEQKTYTEMVHSSRDVTITVKMVTDELPLHLGERVVVWGCQLRRIGRVLDEFKSTLDGWLHEARCCPCSQTVLTCNFQLPEKVKLKVINFKLSVQSLKELNCTCI